MLSNAGKRNTIDNKFDAMRIAAYIKINFFKSDISVQFLKIQALAHLKCKRSQRWNWNYSCCQKCTYVTN